MRDAPDPRIKLEVGLVRLADPEADDSRSALLERVERLERLLGERGDGVAAVPTVRSVPVTPRAEVRPPPGPPPPVTATAPSAAAPGPSAGAVGQSALGAHRRPRPPGGPSGPEPPTGPPTRSPAAPPPQTAASGPLPSREALTIAWGDTILPGLRAGVKIYLSAGRFVGVDEAGAVYAVPDKGLLVRAEPNRAEVEAALAAHFGRPVPLRLVLDEAVGAVEAPMARPEPDAEDPGAIDFADLQDAPAALVSPEQRLLEAFPGAEEVSP
jgi:DNA polymerase III subunit gamma/tau